MRCVRECPFYLFIFHILKSFFLRYLIWSVLVADWLLRWRVANIVLNRVSLLRHCRRVSARRTSKGFVFFVSSVLSPSGCGHNPTRQNLMSTDSDANSGHPDNPFTWAGNISHEFTVCMRRAIVRHSVGRSTSMTFLHIFFSSLISVYMFGSAIPRVTY